MRLLGGRGEQAASGLGGAVPLPLGPREVHLQPDEPLLRAVVDVPLEPLKRAQLALAGVGELPAMGLLQPQGPGRRLEEPAVDAGLGTR